MKRIFILAIVLLLTLIPFGCKNAPAATPGDGAQTLMPPSAGDAIEASNGNAISPADAGAEIKNYEELVAALNDTNVTRAHISADMEISSSEEQTFEREGFILTIDEGVTVTLGDGFIMVFFGSEEEPGVVVNGTLKIQGTMDFGAMTLLNNGTLEILSGGLLAPGMSTIENHGTVSIDSNGQIRLERGSGLQNYANLVNQGTIDITDDGGSLQNLAGATLENNGHIAFNGNYQNEGVYQGAEQEPQGAVG
ncbi:MAG: hypothetical protein VB034_06930 [Eubacteriales bacterium]|nr:hypothetical protein [Eubacteriales bacterium]